MPKENSPKKFPLRTKVALAMMDFAFVLSQKGCVSPPLQTQTPEGQGQSVPLQTDIPIRILSSYNLTPESEEYQRLVAQSADLLKADQEKNIVYTDRQGQVVAGSLKDIVGTVSLDNGLIPDPESAAATTLPYEIKAGDQSIIINPVYFEVNNENDPQQKGTMFFLLANINGQWREIYLIDSQGSSLSALSVPDQGVFVNGLIEGSVNFAFPLINESISFDLMAIEGKPGAGAFNTIIFASIAGGQKQLVIQDENGIRMGPMPDDSFMKVGESSEPQSIPPTPFPKPTDIPLFINVSYTNSLPETSTPTATETPSVPMIEVDGLQIPDPKASNPELFNLTSPDSPIVQFANAFGVNPEEVGDLTPQLLTGIDGKQLVVLTTGDLAATSTFDESGTPLLMATQVEEQWQWQEATLRELGERRGIRMGAFYGGNNTTSLDFENIARVIREEFGLAGIWVGMSTTQPEEGTFDLNVRIALMDRAKQDDLSVLIHPLVWWDDAPDWIRSQTGDQLLASISNHVSRIAQEVEKNSGADTQPIMIVVNEANGPRDFYYERLGFSYVETAFRAARNKAPSALLIYNDYNNHTLNGERYQNTKDIVEGLQVQGLIDGVGIQLIIDGDNPPSKDAVIEAMRSYGIPVYVTEFSVNMRNVQGSAQERNTIQAEIYKTMTEACVEAGTCKAFVDFQLGDKFSVWETIYNTPNADPTPYDDNLDPKMAFYAQEQAFITSSSP